MEFPNGALVDLLKYLLPGLVAASILDGLTPAPKPTPFERIVQALIFTILVQVGVFAARSVFLWIGVRVFSLGEWSDDVATGWSVAVATLLGLAFTWAANTDKVHALLRRFHITRETSYSSQWYRAFCQNAEYIVLHVAGNRRLYGFPDEWPSVPGKGHFLMVRAAWLDDDKSTELPGVHRILIRAEDIEMVELMRPSAGENKDGTKGKHIQTNSPA